MTWESMTSFFFFFFFFFCSLGPHWRHMEVPRLGVQLEQWLLSYTRATATRDWNRIFNLHQSSWQCQILNPLSEAKDWTLNLMVTDQIHFRCATKGTPSMTSYWSEARYDLVWKSPWVLEINKDCLTGVQVPMVGMAELSSLTVLGMPSVKGFSHLLSHPWVL